MVLEIRGIWHCHMSRWDRYVLRPRIWMETSRSVTVPHIGPYINADPKLAGEKRLMNLTSLDEWRSEAYESAKMFKEMVKKWHDRRILKREINVGDKVLLFRSHFRFSPGKLLSRWEGPFHIEEVYRSGAIKINNFEGTKPQVVNGQRLKHYMVGDPINVDVNMIYTRTHEEHVAA